MAGANHRSRKRRFTAVEKPSTVGDRLFGLAGDGDLLARAAALAAATLAVLLLTQAWNPPFVYRLGDVPDRDVLSRTELPDETATQEARDRERAKAPFVYRNNPFPIQQLRDGLDNLIAGLRSQEELPDVATQPWKDLLPKDKRENFPEAEQEQWVRELIAELAEPGQAEAFRKAVAEALRPNEERGLLERLTQQPTEGDQGRIEVRAPGEELGFIVAVEDVRIADAKPKIQARLQTLLAEAGFAGDHVALASSTWINQKLGPTLTLDEVATERARNQAAEMVPTSTHPPGHLIAPADSPISNAVAAELNEEYQAVAEQEPAWTKLGRLAAAAGMYAAIACLCGWFLDGRRIWPEWRSFWLLLAFASAAVVLAYWASFDPARAELIPILVFALTMSIAYGKEPAMLLSFCASLAVAFHSGRGIASLVTLAAGSAACILALGRIRKRTVLIRVGLIAAVVVAITTPGAEFLAGRPLSWQLLQRAAVNAGWALAAGCIVTVLLPALERLFGILTELRLLELGDASHPLLQELVRRAPGTYNHSINVASLAEAAAERIGARGLLVRVGAYFHDIGKMLKPEYFVENQERGSNQHDSLVPAMSKLIIVAHVKDGAQLARSYRLPRRLIDFIEQHHGTTLVEYFYRRASEQQASDPNCQEVSEETYRYPGPKPQTKEAAVLMLADVVESAARALVEPTPSRIESLVREMARKRLLDGQFDDCELTLQELHAISDSLIKSLNAVYHGRMKYAPEAASA